MPTETRIQLNIESVDRNHIWQNSICFLPHQRLIKLRSTREGLPAPTPHEFHLIHIPNDVADLALIEAHLARPDVQKALAEVADEYLDDEPGQCGHTMAGHLGRLTHELELLLHDLPTHWDPSRWFDDSQRPATLLDIMETHGGIVAAAKAETAAALPNVLNVAEVEVFLRRCLGHFIADGADDNDPSAVALALRARALLAQEPESQGPEPRRIE